MKKDEINPRVMFFKTASCGPTQSFNPLITLTGFEKIESKDNKRFYELMRDLMYECHKMGVHFESKIYETKDISLKLDFAPYRKPIQSPTQRADGYPIIKEIVGDGSFKIDAKDENFSKPLSELEKEY